jgi:hypothetical protein
MRNEDDMCVSHHRATHWAFEVPVPSRRVWTDCVVDNNGTFLTLWPRMQPRINFFMNKKNLQSLSQVTCEEFLKIIFILALFYKFFSVFLPNEKRVMTPYKWYASSSMSKHWSSVYIFKEYCELYFFQRTYYLMNNILIYRQV